MSTRLLDGSKALRTLRKTPAILEMALAGVTQEQAATLRDGPDGWSVLFIVCHLRDYDVINGDRIRLMLEQDNPTFPASSNDELIVRNNYAGQDLRATLARYQASRKTLIALLEELDAEQWERRGVHPVYGPGIVVDAAVNTAIHDVDHIEQILRCLGKA